MYTPFFIHFPTTEIPPMVPTLINLNFYLDDRAPDTKFNLYTKIPIQDVTVFVKDDNHPWTDVRTMGTPKTFTSKDQVQYEPVITRSFGGTYPGFSEPNVNRYTVPLFVNLRDFDPDSLKYCPAYNVLLRELTQSSELTPIKGAGWYFPNMSDSKDPNQVRIFHTGERSGVGYDAMNNDDSKFKPTVVYPHIITQAIMARDNTYLPKIEDIDLSDERNLIHIDAPESELPDKLQRFWFQYFRDKVVGIGAQRSNIIQGWPISDTLTKLDAPASTAPAFKDNHPESNGIPNPKVGSDTWRAILDNGISGFDQLTLNINTVFSSNIVERKDGDNPSIVSLASWLDWAKPAQKWGVRIG